MRGGHDLINRVHKFYRSLVIKINNEADVYDTPDMTKKYNEYRDAVRKADSLLDYSITESDLERIGITYLKRQEYMTEPFILYEDRNMPILLSFLESKRVERIDTYVEVNPYYRIMLGLPISNVEITVPNFDDNNEDSTIAIHLIDPIV